MWKKQLMGKWGFWSLNMYEKGYWAPINYHINGLVQERHNSIANALELRLVLTHWYVVLHQLLQNFVPKWDESQGTDIDELPLS